MPQRPKHPCGVARCPALVEAGQRLCRAHQRQTNIEYNRTQRPARHSFYHTREWRALARQVKEEQPYCIDGCGRPTEQADHIISVKDRPDLALERSNVVGRCRICHSRRTVREHGRWGARA